MFFFIHINQCKKFFVKEILRLRQAQPAVILHIEAPYPELAEGYPGAKPSRSFLPFFHSSRFSPHSNGRITPMPDTFLQQLLRLPEVTSAYLSPDGRHIAFDWNRRHPNRDVFVVPSDGSTPPAALTRTPRSDALCKLDTRLGCRGHGRGSQRR